MSAALTRRLSRTPLPDVASLVVVRAAPADDPLEVRLEGGAHADLDAPSIGISAIRVERGTATTRIALRRPQAVGKKTVPATVTALVLDDDRAVAKLVTRDVLVGSGDGVVMKWNGATFL